MHPFGAGWEFAAELCSSNGTHWLEARTGWHACINTSSTEIEATSSIGAEPSASWVRDRIRGPTLGPTSSASRLARNLQHFLVNPVEQGAAGRIKLSGKEAPRGSHEVIAVFGEDYGVWIAEVLPLHVVQRLGTADARVAAHDRNEERFRWDNRPFVPAA